MHAPLIQVVVSTIAWVLPWIALQASAQDLAGQRVRIGAVVPYEDPDLPLSAAVARAARQGTILAEEEFGFNAELLGIDFAVLIDVAEGDEVVAAADRLVEAGAFGIVGGFTEEEARLLSEWGATSEVPFFNIGASADSLRNEHCAATTFHLESSAAMYLDAYAGWFVRSGFRRWYFVQGDAEENRSQYERMRWSLSERHFGAREVGHTVIGADDSIEELGEAVLRSRADVVVLLLGTLDQLRVLGALEDAGVDTEVTGFPYPEAQTRAFFAASVEAAPKLGAGHRATAWEASIDAYGGREYNARYLLRWEEPMEPSAWAAFHAVKILYEAALFGGSTATEDVTEHLLDPASIFDLHKGIGVSFRPWDNQLRQSLYLVKIKATAQSAMDRGLLVGELPAIYLPGTDLLERLDQLGDLAAQSRCTR